MGFENEGGRERAPGGRGLDVRRRNEGVFLGGKGEGHGTKRGDLEGEGKGKGGSRMKSPKTLKLSKVHLKMALNYKKFNCLYYLIIDLMLNHYFKINIRE